MKLLSAFLFTTICFFCFQKNDNKVLCINQEAEIKCSDKGCFGIYKGPEFINGSDVAHQFSNKMSHKVGNKLKELYKSNNYHKVDFSKIEMKTNGMGLGNVIYELSVPFISVKEKCEAFTSFDHVGGWNHIPSLSKRKKELSKVLMKGQNLNISELKKTPEGLQEYWIQWRNKNTQADCQ